MKVLPQPLPKECLKAAKIFQSFVDNSNNGLDGVIPREVLENAKGFAIFTIVKAGFVFSARAGSGIVIAKTDNSWSAPSAIGIAGFGVGGQAGAEMTDFLIVLNSRSAIQSFMAAGSLTLGGNMSLALGPLGRSSEAAGALNTNGKLAAMYSYSRSRGLFGGVSIEGSVIMEREDANSLAYESPVTARLLLGGHVPPPTWAMPLVKTLAACTGLPGNRQWIDDHGNRKFRGNYFFGGLASPGSGSSSLFFRKKKKDFPPTSWGVETNNGSYFSDETPPSHSRSMTWSGTTPSSETDFEGTISRSQLADADNPFAAFQSSISISPTTLSPPHRRNSSLITSSNASHNSRIDNNVYRPKSMIKPLIKSREELTRPLLPHEGVARAIALFNFDAVEDGDLSFKKGDIIVITKKSDSTDDWWTGKVGASQGMFPANFVEIV